MAERDLRDLFESILRDVPTIRQTVAFSSESPAHELFRAVRQRLLDSDALHRYPELLVSASLGKGNWSIIPWISLLDRRMTTTTQEGVYVVYLFRADMSGFYLTLNQGVTHAQNALGKRQARRYLEKHAREIRVYARELTQRGFKLDHRIELRTDRGVGAAYQDSTIVHKLYQAGTVPNEETLVADLEAALKCYREYVADAKNLGDDETSIGVRDEPTTRESARQVTETATISTRSAERTSHRVDTSPEMVSAICSSFSLAIEQSHIRFGLRHETVVRAFISSLLTKRFVILSGLSGSGKTQIALRFGEWFGPSQHLLVAVRPDWNGPESLLGFEDALADAKAVRRPWLVPAALEFILRAARSPTQPYLLILDEMNLAHVERYFADMLAGIEAGTGCIPNLEEDASGRWRLQESGPATIPFPRNLFIAGTVNIDETTYMFSPKVLDRANTLEFRVGTSDLIDDARAPVAVPTADSRMLAAFSAIAANAEWHREFPAPKGGEFTTNLRHVHSILTESGFEFGHRVFFEAQRFSAILAASGEADPHAALDLQVVQKVLPRLHGSRRRLEPVLIALAQFAYDLTVADGQTRPTAQFDPLAPVDAQPRLPLSFDKLVRMTRSLRTNQFASFME